MLITDRYIIEEFLEEWLESTEKIVGAAMKKNKVFFSDNARINIRIRLIQNLVGYSEFHFIYRDSLRFTEMGAGQGYNKGQRINQAEYRKAIDKGRKRKKILMKPIFGRIANLQSLVAAKLIQDISNDFQILNDVNSNR